ncbi:MAG: acyltransferase [Acetobacter sp.]|nr:acyltransferase [Acetobacter sp.]
MIKEKKFLLIQALRVYACLLVIFGHYFYLYIDSIKVSNIYTNYFSEYIIQPLNFNTGNLGVIQFFFISGFVITMVGMRENRFEFIIKRFFRIFPPILFSLLIVVLLYNIFYFTHTTKFIEANHSVYLSFPTWSQLTIGEFLRNLFLIDTDIDGVMWTLRIEALFYLLVFVFLPLLKTKPAQLYWGISSIIIGWYISKSIWGG